MTTELTYEQYLAAQLKNPEFAAAWEATAPAHQLKRLRFLQRLSQKKRGHAHCPLTKTRRLS